MGFFEFAIAATVFGCGTAVILTFMDKVFGSKHKTAQAETKVAQEKVLMLEARLIDAHRQNDQLQKQLEWHTKMLDTQDRLMKQLADSGASDRSGERTLTASRS